MLREPICHLRRDAKGARSVFAAKGAPHLLTDVELGEYRFSLRRIHRVVAQHVALTRAIFDRCNCVLADSMLVQSCITRSVGIRERSAHVPWVRQANELDESRIQWRDLDVHVPLGRIRHELQKWCRHAVARRLGLHLGQINLPNSWICVSIRAPGYGDGANAICVGALRADECVVIGREPSAGLEAHLPWLTRPHYGPGREKGSQLTR